MIISSFESHFSTSVQTSHLLDPLTYIFSYREESLHGLGFMVQSIKLETERDALINCHGHAT